MPKITPFLWFDDQAEEAMKFYTSVFRDSHMGTIRRFSEAVPGPKGKTLTGRMTLLGQDFMLLNGGPIGEAFTFNQAISFYVEVDDQQEVDYYWKALTTDGGTASQCGWLSDKYGVTWQIVPKQLEQLMSDPDREKSDRVTKAMLRMGKLDIAELEAAYRGDA